jgi:hypothetical protein
MEPPSKHPIQDELGSCETMQIRTVAGVHVLDVRPLAVDKSTLRGEKCLFGTTASTTSSTKATQRLRVVARAVASGASASTKRTVVITGEGTIVLFLSFVSTPPFSIPVLTPLGLVGLGFAPLAGRGNQRSRTGSTR